MGRRWTVNDRQGIKVYLTDERWDHIIDPFNHPEMEGFETELRETIFAIRTPNSGAKMFYCLWR